MFFQSRRKRVSEYILFCLFEILRGLREPIGLQNDAQMVPLRAGTTVPFTEADQKGSPDVISYHFGIILLVFPQQKELAFEGPQVPFGTSLRSF